jgi:DNA-directed RNA polymerase specialized sigma24 family protein
MLALSMAVSIMHLMNKLPISKRVQVLNLLCEGMSMRAVARVADVSFNTVAKALIDAGAVCAQMHDELSTT